MSEVMQALRAGVPLTLLLDLAYASGPDSADILSREGGEPWPMRADHTEPA